MRTGQEYGKWAPESYESLKLFSVLGNPVQTVTKVRMSTYTGSSGKESSQLLKNNVSPHNSI